MFLHQRRHDCRTSPIHANGYDVVFRDNDVVRMSDAQERGAEIVELRDTSCEMDVLARTPWPLRNALTRRAWPSTPSTAFLDDDAGVLQEAFPTRGNPTRTEDGEMGVHGEVTSLATRPLPVIVGHHPCLSTPLLQPGCSIETDASTMRASDVRRDPTAQRPSKARTTSSNAQSIVGAPVDVPFVPAAEYARHEWAYLTDFASVWISLRHPFGDPGVALTWCENVIPYPPTWRDHGGTRQAPLCGRGDMLGLEPLSLFPARHMHGRATPWIDAGSELPFHMSVTLFEGIGRAQSVSPDGGVT